MDLRTVRSSDAEMRRLNGRAPRVGFVMPCHNYGRYLAQALDSLLGQTFKDIEILVIDDASTDETAELLKSYERNDERIRVIRHERRRGHLLSNNEGLSLMRADFVGIFDADDFLLRSDVVERQVGVFDANPGVGFVYNGYLLVDEDGRPFREFLPWPHDYVRSGLEEFRSLVRSLYVPHSSTLVRRAFHDRTEVYDLSLPYSGDWDVWLRLAAKHDVAYLGECLLAYRQHRRQMTQQRISPRAATDNLLRTIDNAFAALPPDVVPGLTALRRDAVACALLHQTKTDRSLGRVRRSWVGLVDAARRSPRLLLTATFHWNLMRLVLLTIIGQASYVRLVTMHDRLAGGKAPVA